MFSRPVGLEPNVIDPEIAELFRAEALNLLHAEEIYIVSIRILRENDGRVIVLLVTKQPSEKTRKKLEDLAHNLSARLSLAAS